MAECAFCGQDKKLTKEHVWPKWLLEMLPDLDPEARNVRTLGRGDASGYHEVQRDEGPKTVPSTVQIVCELHCNNGWMSQLESEAKTALEPMIFGHRCEVRTRDQRLIAFWAAKTTMVLEYTDPATRSATAEQRHVLYAQRESWGLPDKTRVWIGYHNHAGPLTRGYAHRALKVVRRIGGIPVEAGPEHPNVQQTTLRIGRLVVVVLSTTLDTRCPDMNFGEVGGCLRAIAPTARHLRWPLGRKLDDEAMAMLSNAVLFFPGPPPAELL